jgi:hypothetical protein
MKKEGATAADAKESCECCADSCDMSKHDGKMKHDSKGHKDGECCKMKTKDKNKNKT